MGKIRINMLSQATSVDGQGVASAYIEQLALVKECDDIFEVEVNSRKSNFDIYHMHTVNPSYRARFNNRHVNVAYVHFIPSTLDGSLKMPKLFFKIFKKYVISTYRKADEIVVVNPSFIPPLMELGIEKDNITYIPNFVDHEKFYKISQEERDALRKKYDIPLDKFVVMGCGQVQTRKGVLDFIEVSKRNPDKVFVWAGGFSFGKMTDGYHELKAIMDNPPENVKFIGIIPRDEMNGIFNLCDMLFMPSLSELFPMSILEAVNSYKPVLLRDLDLYEEILFKNQECYAVGKNVDEFDAEVKKLASDKKYYEKYSKGSKVISDYYSKEHVKNIWREYYPRIVEKWAPKKKLKTRK
ncbi:MAG: glycosyltransferase family 4 protein [Bacilli bacterium]|nr:glycosyltransferase family 4 protein [Bacilli bacterium]